MKPLSPTALGAIFLVATAALPLPSQVQWQLTGSGSGPNATGAGYAYDAARSELVLFGGENAGGMNSQTLAWNGVTWQTRAVAIRPSTRVRATMAYDEARGNVVLFGGFAGGNTFFGDTWIWNGTSWTQVFPPNSPSSRSGASAYFDPTRGTVVLFGGFRPNNVDANDMWEWNGASWSSIASGSGPAPRGAHRIIYHAATQQAVLHGGYSRASQTTLDDTWVWTGTAWAQRFGTRPGSLCDQATAYDPYRQRTVLFGGLFINVAQNQFIDQGSTWDWTGSNWQMRAPGGSPSARNHGYAYFDAASESVRMAAGAASGATMLMDAWSLSSMTPARITPYGTPCPSTAGFAQLTAETQPWIDDTLVLRVDNLAPTTVSVFFALGVRDTNWGTITLPFDLSIIGAIGCTLDASIQANIAAPNVGGSAQASVPLCNCPSLIATPWFSQVIAADPALPWPLPLYLSGAIKIEPGIR